MTKTLGNTDSSGTSENVPDVFRSGVWSKAKAEAQTGTEAD